MGNEANADNPQNPTPAPAAQPAPAVATAAAAPAVTEPAASSAPTPAPQPVQAVATPIAQPTPAAAAPQGPKGTPDEAQRDQRLQNENKELKDALKVIAPLFEKLGIEAETPAAATQTVDAAAEAKHEEEKTSWAVEKQLLIAGCVDTVGALAHVDFKALKLADGKLEGFDIGAFTKDHPLYFSKPATVSTGGNPAGGNGANEMPKTIKEALAQTKL